MEGRKAGGREGGTEGRKEGKRERRREGGRKGKDNQFDQRKPSPDVISNHILEIFLYSFVFMFNRYIDVSILGSKKVNGREAKL